MIPKKSTIKGITIGILLLSPVFYYLLHPYRISLTAFITHTTLAKLMLGLILFSFFLIIIVSIEKEKEISKQEKAKPSPRFIVLAILLVAFLSYFTKYYYYPLIQVLREKCPCGSWHPYDKKLDLVVISTKELQGKLQPSGVKLKHLPLEKHPFNACLWDSFHSSKHILSRKIPANTILENPMFEEYQSKTIILVKTAKENSLPIDYPAEMKIAQEAFILAEKHYAEIGENPAATYYSYKNYTLVEHSLQILKKQLIKNKIYQKTIIQKIPNNVSILPPYQQKFRAAIQAGYLRTANKRRRELSYKLATNYYFAKNEFLSAVKTKDFFTMEKVILRLKKMFPEIHFNLQTKENYLLNVKWMESYFERLKKTY